MDIRTLIIASLVVALSANLLMVLMRWTRHTYPGFDYWVAATCCRSAAAVLFLFPRDQFPAWLTIILANYLILAAILLDVRGLLIFRGRPAHWGWELGASVSFCTAFVWLSYGAPNVSARIVVMSLFIAGLALRMNPALLTRRPAYFGAGDVLLAITWSGLVITYLVRALYTAELEPSIADFLTASTVQGAMALILIAFGLLSALGQILINTQRFEYDYRLAHERLGQGIVARLQSEAALRESEEKFRLAFNNANTGMCLVDLQGRVFQVNDKMSAIFGYQREELEGMTVSEMAIAEDATVGRWFMDRALDGESDQLVFEQRYRHKGDAIIHGEVACSLVRDAAGNPRYFISQVQDITDRKQLQEALREQAIRDPLTGLYSRRYLDDILPPELQRCAMSREPLTIAMLDLDHFKRFNDGYGHEAGDSVLRAVGQILRKAMRGSDIACRYGGEELTVVLPGATLAQARRRLAEVQHLFARLHLRHQSQVLPAVTASIGLAAAQPGESAATLLGRADGALYRAKAQGRDCIVAAGATA